MARQLQVSLQPSVLRWARQRASFSEADLAEKLKLKVEQVAEWERSGKISIARIDKLARATRTPLGFLYLREPPEDNIPITDFRTRDGRTPMKPSPDLLETIHMMKLRQDWMRDELISEGQDPLGFVGKYSLHDPVKRVAEAMGEILKLKVAESPNSNTRAGFLKTLREHILNVGILVFFNGIVGNNTHRPLDVEEMQGFALTDAYAPLIFVNAADHKAAQIFTLAHELAHIFVGQQGISTLKDFQPSDHEVERFCNSVAAEFLVPEEILQETERKGSAAEWLEIARKSFNASSVVVARRAWDLGMINRVEFSEFYHSQKRKWGKNPKKSGGDFWKTQEWRVGARFGAAVMRAAQAERLLYRDAYRLTGLHGDTFENMKNRLGIKL